MRPVKSTSSKFIQVLSFITLIGISANYALAEDSSYLFGDWDGMRTSLEEKGISFESVLTYDVIRNTSGGHRVGTAGFGNHNLTANFDLDKLDIVKGGTFFGYLIGSFGRSPSANYIGDFQIADNIDAEPAVRLYELWYQQNFMEDKLSFLIGVHEYNSDFDVLNYGLNLLNSSFGEGVDISQTPPSTYPTTTLGARVRFEPIENTYVLLGLYDGLAGDPNHPKSTRISFGSNDGIYSAYEAGYLEDSEVSYKKFALGGWYSTREYEDYNGNMRDNNAGIYLLNEAKLLDEGNEDAQGLGYFNAIGFAKSDRNQVDFYTGIGFMYTGLIPERDNDVLSMGLAYARNSRDFVDATESELLEKAFEIQYKVQILEYFTMAPDFQYIVNPGMTPDQKDAIVIGIRTEVAM